MCTYVHTHMYVHAYMHIEKRYTGIRFTEELIVLFLVEGLQIIFVFCMLVHSFGIFYNDIMN